MTVFLHIGEPKTGTTYLQQVLWRNRSELAVSGVMLPGPRPLAHWRAAQDLREVEQADNDPIGPFAGAWDRLARQALRAPRVAVISHELLSAASEEQAARAVRSFGAAEVHVILTVRDLGTLLPAEWQETIKHRSARAWDDWLADVIDHEATQPNRREWWFWRVHDTLEILRIWSRHLPPERVHVITTPPRRNAPADLLWRRFASVIGVDPDSVDASRAGDNSSLGMPAIEFLRRVNAALPPEVPDWFYMRQVKDLLAHDALAKLPRAGRLILPPERLDWAVEQARALVAGLQNSPYTIVGNLDELLAGPSGETSSHPGSVTSEDLLEVATLSVTTLLQAGAHEAGVAAARTANRSAGQPAAEPARGTVKRTLIAASRRSQAVHRLRRGYWHTVNTVRRIRAAAAARKVSR